MGYLGPAQACVPARVSPQAPQRTGSFNTAPAATL
jgi:hypothetical protein